MEAATAAAALKAKLSYMDMEAAKKAELERVQTMRDLDIAEAKLQTIIKMEQEDEYYGEGPEALPITDGMHEYVREYVAAHAMEDRTEFDSQPMKKPTSLPHLHMSQCRLPHTLHKLVHSNL